VFIFGAKAEEVEELRSKYRYLVPPLPFILNFVTPEGTAP